MDEAIKVSSCAMDEAIKVSSCAMDEAVNDWYMHGPTPASSVLPDPLQWLSQHKPHYVLSKVSDPRPGKEAQSRYYRMQGDSYMANAQCAVPSDSSAHGVISQITASGSGTRCGFIRRNAG